jgi:hypothetical protein
MWSEEEDQNLRRVMALPEEERAAALGDFAGRSVQSCRRRWQRLCDEDAGRAAAAPRRVRARDANGRYQGRVAPSTHATVPVPRPPRPRAASRTTPSAVEEPEPPSHVSAAPGAVAEVNAIAPAMEPALHARPGRDDIFAVGPGELAGPFTIRGQGGAAGNEIACIRHATGCQGQGLRLAMVGPFGGIVFGL